MKRNNFCSRTVRRRDTTPSLILQTCQRSCDSLKPCLQYLSGGFTYSCPEMKSRTGQNIIEITDRSSAKRAKVEDTRHETEVFGEYFYQPPNFQLSYIAKTAFFSVLRDWLLQLGVNDWISGSSNIRQASEESRHTRKMFFRFFFVSIF